ncbi:MAG: secretion protein, partial [Synergistaceae bacterium]|nr:secretion protein [Synergistaceae bacterium]
EKPLEPKAVRGIPPADTYTLSLKTSEETRKLIEERVATSQPQTLQVPTGPFASNVPITLDLRNADLRDVFRMFGEHVKKNIIIHEENFPHALVTMTFRNAPLSTVFGYIMTNPNYDLAYEFLGNDTIVIGKRTELGKLSGKMETRAYRIAYADPAALSNLLPNLTKITSANLVVDPRLRTVYATATPDVLEEVAIAVQRLDHPGKQVMIHARVLEFFDNDSLEIETALNAVYDHWAFTYGAGEISGIYADDNRIGRPSSIPNRMLPPGLANIVTPMDGVWRTFDASFRALESRGRTKTIANPSVITIDGIRAQINLTEEVPYISGRDDGGNATWSTISIGPRLSFTPRVGRDNTITLDLDLQSSEEGTTMAGSMGEIMPTSVQRQVLTNVRVRNGEPFVVGGLYSTQNINNRTRVPVLGQLPLLGELFTFRTRRTRTTQVVMVVIPYILDTPDVAVDHERVMLRQ